MDKKEVTLIIKALADGIHPVTGEVFPPDSPYQDVYITRGLFHAINLIEKSKPKSLQKTELPNNAGNPWTNEEDHQLKEAFEAGSTIDELSDKHHRTKGAIKSRLTKLGFFQP